MNACAQSIMYLAIATTMLHGHGTSFHKERVQVLHYLKVNLSYVFNKGSKWHLISKSFIAKMLIEMFRPPDMLPFSASLISIEVIIFYEVESQNYQEL